MTFLLAEDEALRDLLVGMTVSDSKNPRRSVGVWFGQPDPEIQGQNYPFVTIDLIDISEATERMMAGGHVRPWYLEPDDLGDAEDWAIRYPVPVNLDYQVTTYSRQPRHDRQIMAQILGNRLPLRFGSLPVVHSVEDDVPQATMRRIDFVDLMKRDLVESGKRLFMNAITVRVSSEMPQPFDYLTYMKVREVVVDGNTSPPPTGPNGSTRPNFVNIRF